MTKNLINALLELSQALYSEITRLPEEISKETLRGYVKKVEYLNKNYDYVPGCVMESFDKTFEAWENYRNRCPIPCKNCGQGVSVYKVTATPHEEVEDDIPFTTIMAQLSCLSCGGVAVKSAINVDIYEDITEGISKIKEDVRLKWNERNK